MSKSSKDEDNKVINFKESRKIIEGRKPNKDVNYKPDFSKFKQYTQKDDKKD